MTDGARGGFLAGVLLGVATGVLIAPRRKRMATTPADIVAPESPVEPEDQDAAAALRARIEETRRRLREQVGLESQP